MWLGGGAPEAERGRKRGGGGEQQEKRPWVGGYGRDREKQKAVKEADGDQGIPSFYLAGKFMVKVPVCQDDPFSFLLSKLLYKTSSYQKERKKEGKRQGEREMLKAITIVHRRTTKYSI